MYETPWRQPSRSWSPEDAANLHDEALPRVLADFNAHLREMHHHGEVTMEELVESIDAAGRQARDSLPMDGEPQPAMKDP